jgi:hypothetical protein
LNCNVLEPAEIERSMENPATLAHFDYLFAQYISRFDFEAFDPGLLKMIGFFRDSRDFKLVRRALQGEKQIELGSEPRDLYMPN